MASRQQAHGGTPDTAARLDDPALAARLRAGEPAALELVVQAYLPQILRAARGAGLDPSQAEDVTQATFTTFIETASRFEGRSHVRTWIFGILYRKVSEHRRGTARDREMDVLDDVMEHRFDVNGSWSRPQPTADTRVYAREIKAHLATCLDELNPAQRHAFLLREVQEFTTSEICKILDVTTTNLGVMLYRARNRLRECLAAAGVRT